MDHFKHQKIQALKKLSKSQYLKKAIQFIFSVSVISFIFSNTSLLPFLVQSFNAYYSTICTYYSAERNCMFLLFNGILVFIVKNSGLIGNSAALETLIDVERVKNNNNGGSHCEAPALSETRALLVAVAVKEIEEEYERNDDGLLIIEEDLNEELPVAPEQEDIRLLSTEELNKKCDEFIRKMKEVIKIEAKQLIMV